ncbi:TrkH family potassium uptake protein, partial [Neisseria meningitidis]|nr:TrkH family potassium uptake protein [Neisseria meningitidis]
MHKILPIAHVLSRLGMLFSFILLIPAALSYAFSDGAYTAFATTATVTLSGSCIV